MKIDETLVFPFPMSAEEKIEYAKTFMPNHPILQSIEKKFYEIEYYNRAFKEKYTIQSNDFKEALDKARSVKSLVEMENVKLYEIREIDFV